jgi:hypothetical protein
MSHPERAAETGTSGRGANVGPVLDTAFGFFVWAVHLVVIYVATAIACQLGLGTSGEGGRRTFQIALVLVTLIALAIVVVHALLRFGQLRRETERRFRLQVTTGGDALSFAAIAWQLFAILIVPLCR